MQISLTSRTFFSSRNRQGRRGFTLVELLVSIAIIGVVTSIVLVRYNTFDSSVLLKSLAYEIGLSLREAQVRSVSVSKNIDNFDYPFGMSFSLTSPKQYLSFRYKDAAPTAYPKFASGGVAEVLRTFKIERTMAIVDLCIYGTGLADPCDVSQLDVSFRRPKFTGLFRALNGAGNIEYTTTITSARIKVGSATPGNVFVVEVTNLGQISVYKE